MKTAFLTRAGDACLDLLPTMASTIFSTFLLLTLTPIAGAETQTGANARSPEFAPAETRDMLFAKAKIEKLGTSESFQLALALYRNGQLIQALTTASLALGSTTNQIERAALYALVSEAEGARGKYREAAQAALEGQRCNPNSPELALLRFAYFSKLGNEAQAMSASDCLEHTDENSGSPVFSVALGVIVITFGKQVIEILADAYQVWYRGELEDGRCPDSWLDNEKVKKTAKVLEKLWRLSEIPLPPLRTGQPQVAK